MCTAYFILRNNVVAMAQSIAQLHCANHFFVDRALNSTCNQSKGPSFMETHLEIRNMDMKNLTSY